MLTSPPPTPLKCTKRRSLSELSISFHTDSTNNIEEDECYFSVASYNLLAPCYVRPIDNRTGDVQQFAAFEWISEADTDEVLNMNKRLPRLLHDLQSCQADVICLQELQLEREGGGGRKLILPPWIRPMMDVSGYGVHLPPQEELERMAERNRRVLCVDVAVTNALLYKMERMTPVPSSKKNDSVTTCVSLCLVGASGCTALSKMKPTSFVSVHLDATSECKRVRQLRKCVRVAQLEEGRLAVSPMVIAGDMNTELEAGSCVAAYLRNTDDDDENEVNLSEEDLKRECSSALRLTTNNNDGVPSEEQMKEWKEIYGMVKTTVHDLCLSLKRVDTGKTRAAYDHSTTSYEKEHKMGQWRLDHIFYTNRLLHPRAIWPTLEQDPESAAIGLPNRRIPSDHMPIAAVFQTIPPVSLGEGAKSVLFEKLAQMKQTHEMELGRLENRLKADLCNIETRLSVRPSAVQHSHHQNNNNKDAKQKKKSKQMRPPQQVIDFTRSKRMLVKALKAEQRRERQAFVDELSDLDRVEFVRHVCCSTTEWVERGSPKC